MNPPLPGPRLSEILRLEERITLAQAAFIAARLTGDASVDALRTYVEVLQTRMNLLGDPDLPT